MQLLKAHQFSSSINDLTFTAYSIIASHSSVTYLLQEGHISERSYRQFFTFLSRSLKYSVTIKYSVFTISHRSYTGSASIYAQLFINFSGSARQGYIILHSDALYRRFTCHNI